MKIMLVEDETADVILTERAFLKSRIKNLFIHASCGEKALEYLETGKTLPNIILLDINMPGIGGQKTLQRIKNHEKWRSIPVIMLTSSDAQNDICDSYHHHANSYIKKPGGADEAQKMVTAIDDFWFSLTKHC